MGLRGGGTPNARTGAGTPIPGGGGWTQSPPPGEPFSPSAPLRQPVPQNPPIHPNSATIMANCGWDLGSGSSVKEWLGPRERIGYFKGDFSSLSTVAMYHNYQDGSGFACGVTPATIPMPSGWPTTVYSTTPSYKYFDGVIYFVNASTGDLWEGSRVTAPGSPSRDITCDPSRWNSVRMDHKVAEEVSSKGYYTYGCSASGITMGQGNLRPEDFPSGALSGNTLAHALRLNSNCGSNGTIYPRHVGPAYDGDGTKAQGLPYGCRVQLDPTLNIDTWPSVNAKTEPWRTALKMILKTLQTYGLVPVDGSGGDGAGGLESCFPESVAPYQFPWDAAGYGWGYSNGIPYDLMNPTYWRVIDWNYWTGI